MWILIILSICYTVAFYLSTILTTYYSPLLLVGARGLVSGTILLTAQYLSQKKMGANFARYKYQYLFAITCGSLVPFILTSFILNKLPTVDISVIATLEPLLTYIFANYFFGEKLGKKQLLFLIIGTLITFSAVIVEAGIERVSLISWQEPLVAIIAIIAAIGWLSIEKLVRLNEPTNTIVGCGLITTGIVASFLSLSLESTKFTLNPLVILLFLLMILFGDLIVNRIRTKIIGKYSATLLSLICIFVPFIMAIYEIMFEHIHYSYKFFLILIPALGCFAAFYYEEQRIGLKTNR